MTYDGNDGGSQNTGGYISPTVLPSADKTNLTVAVNDPACAGKPVIGGAALILGGKGAGQVRRIISMSTSVSKPEASMTYAVCHKSFVLDKAFTVAPDATSALQFEPFRGENIFENQRYIDTGGACAAPSMLA